MTAMRATLAALLLAAGLAPSIAAAAPAATTFLTDSAAIERVLALADERLALMPAVAAAKWPRHVPVADPAREAVVIRSAGERAGRMGLDAHAVENWTAVQIRLARASQDRLYAHWDASGFDYPGTAPDLATELRPQLDRLADSSLAALYVAAPILGRPDLATPAAEVAMRALPTTRWSNADRAELLAALAQVRFATAGSAARARAAGILRIGTPGDYAPFAVAKDGTVEGADIELATQLAQALGLRPVFVQSAWRSLTDDLRDDRFDIAVGGISVTPARSALAAFSLPTSRSGKTAIGRCADAAQLTSLATIDAPAITVVVNPGGTNESFARSHLKAAHLAVHDDNRTVFDEILEHRADVMFTDEIEVALATHRHPALCRLLREAYDPADKAFLMPRDAGWTEAVNPWLGHEIALGRPAHVLEDYLAR
jgi:cyclohexadienyl dehydratase